MICFELRGLAKELLSKLRVSFLGTSDIIAVQMAFNRLRSIWKIRIYNSGKRLVISFKRKTKLKSFPTEVLIQVLAAFFISFVFHLPFFLDKSGTGACDYHINHCDTGKFFSNH